MEQFILQYPEICLRIIWLEYIKLLEYNMLHDISIDILKYGDIYLDPPRERLTKNYLSLKHYK